MLLCIRWKRRKMSDKSAEVLKIKTHFFIDDVDKKDEKKVGVRL